MMKKRIITGTLVGVMTLSVATTGLSFADETTTTEDTRGGRPGVERMQGGRQGGMNKEGRGEDRQANKEDREAEMQGVIDEYYPEISDEWNTLKTDIDAARNEIRELVQPEDGERPERPERPDFENMTDEEIEAFESEREAERAERQAERESFETAIEEGDADTIKEHLDGMIEKMEEHLENVEAKLAELQDAAE